MSRVLCALIACAAAFTTACFSPALDGFACGPDRECPKGYECSAANMCVREGTDPGVMPDAGPDPEPDAGPVPGVPTARVVFPLPVGLTEDALVTVRGTASPGAPVTPGAPVAPVRAVRVNGVAATSPNDFLDWSVEVPLALGPNLLRVEVEDSAGVINADADSMSIVRASPLIFEPTGIAVNPAGTLAVVYDRVTDALVSVDLATGERKVVSDAATGSGPLVRIEQVTFTSTGSEVLAVDAPDGTVLAIELATGDRELISGNGRGSGEGLDFPGSLALDEQSGVVFVGDDGDDGNFRLLRVNLANGNRTVLSGTDSGDMVHGAGPSFSFIEDILLDPANNRVLVVDSGLPAVMAVDLATGDRRVLSDAGTGDGPEPVFPVALARGPTPDELYIADRDLEAVLHVDLITGDRTVISDEVTGTGVPLPFMIAMAAHPDGQRIFVADDLHLVPVAVDVATGARSLVDPTTVVGSGPVFEDPEGVAVDGARGLALVSDDGLDAIVAVDLATGERTFLGDDSSVTLADPEGITFDPVAGRAVVLDSTLDACVAIDLGAGARTVLSSDEVGSGPDMSDPQSLALDAAGTTAYVSDLGRAAVFTVNLLTQERTILSDNNLSGGIAFEDPAGLLLDQARNRVVVADFTAEAVIAVDLDSGERTELGAGGSGPDVGGPSAIALTADPDVALVYDELNDRYLLLDLVTGDRTLFSSAELRTGVFLGTPFTLTVDVSRNVLLVADADSGALIAFDIATGERLIVSR